MPLQRCVSAWCSTNREPPTIDDVEAVAQQNTHVLGAMDDLVKLYEAAGK